MPARTKQKKTRKARKARKARVAKTCTVKWGKLAKKYCAHGRFIVDKQHAFTMADLRNDKTKVFLKPISIDGALWGMGYDEGTPLWEKLKKKLSAHAFDIDFHGDKYGYYEPLCDNMIWELSCKHNDIVEIKQL